MAFLKKINPAMGLAAALAAVVLGLNACSFNTAYAPVAAPGLAAPARSPEDCLNAALGAVDAQARSEALMRLRGAGSADGDLLWSARASYLLGLDALAQGRAEAGLFLAEAANDPHIADYALYNLSLSRAGQGDFDSAAALLDSMIALYPESSLLSGAEYHRGAALFGAGDFHAARPAFDAFIAAHPTDALVPDAILNAAIASMEEGGPDDMLGALRVLQIRYPAHPASAALAAMLEAAGVAPPGLSEDERLARADALFAARRYADAAQAFLGVKDPSLRAKAALRAAEALNRLKRYAESETLLSGYLNASRGDVSGARALYLLTVSLIRQDKAWALPQVIDRLDGVYPFSTGRAEALLAAGRFFEGRGDNGKAAGLYQEAIVSFKETSYARDAAWSMGWLRYREGRFGEAHRLLSDGCAGDSAKCSYWGARAAERAGMPDAAERHYRQTCAFKGESYYCQLARVRSHPAQSAPAHCATGLPPGLSPSGAEGPLKADPRFLAAMELKLLGLSKDASAEFDLLSKRHAKDPAALCALVRLFYETGDYYRGLRLFRSNRSAITGVCGAEADGLAYPAGVVAMVRDWAQADDVDPALIASVMREESAFNPEAVSNAGAMGLMQMMPATGRFAARAAREEAFEPKALLLPATSVRLGAWYLGYLIDMFDNDVALSVAAYNAGPGAARKWAGKIQAEPDEFIESIPYAETREYTKRVLGTYALYLRLAGKGPKGRIPMLAQEGGGAGF